MLRGRFFSSLSVMMVPVIFTDSEATNVLILALA